MGASMSKVVAFANAKGGVGKTTAALSMAEASAHLGKSTLLIDLDLQINASITLAGDCIDDMLPWRRNQTIEDYLEERWQNRIPNPLNYIDRSQRVHLLSGSPSITFFERRVLIWRDTVFEARNCVNFWMLDVLRAAKQHYDLVICDTPPGLSLLAESAIKSADLIVVPQIPDRLSTQGLQRYAKYFQEDLEMSDVARRTAVFINMFDGRTDVAERYADAIRREAMQPSFPYRVFQNQYRAKVAFKESMDRSRNKRFEEIWAGVDADVLAATRELWSLLGWIRDEGASNENLASSAGSGPSGSRERKGTGRT
jgi:cellulose biosynthesis protein BcsQ